MRVVVTRPILEAGFPLLAAHDVVVEDFGVDGPSEDQLIEAAEQAEALLSMLSDPITERVLDRCPDLKVVAQYAVGYDNIDLAAARKQGIVVTHTPDVLTDATADFAFALMLAAARRLLPADRYVRAGRFQRWETDLLLGTDLRGKKLGIIGMGRIGAAVARRALGFGMRVIYHNRSRVNPTIERLAGARYVPLQHLIEESDVLSLHCSLNPASHHLIGAEALDMMKPSAILVNTARGAIVDEEALVEALRDGVIAAAGLDVFEREPEVHQGLMDLDNVVLAPHLGSATVEARTKMARMCCESILAVFSGSDKIPYEVPATIDVAL